MNRGLFKRPTVNIGDAENAMYDSACVTPVMVQLISRVASKSAGLAITGKVNLLIN